MIHTCTIVHVDPISELILKVLVQGLTNKLKILHYGLLTVHVNTYIIMASEALLH